jgi:hypothetical protein
VLYVRKLYYIAKMALLCPTQQNVRANAKEELQQNHHADIEPKLRGNAMNANARHHVFAGQWALTEIVGDRRRVGAGNIAAFVLGNTVHTSRAHTRTKQRLYMRKRCESNTNLVQTKPAIQQALTPKQSIRIEQTRGSWPIQCPDAWSQRGHKSHPES